MMACLACHRLTLKSVYDMCGFCFIGFLWGEYVMMACLACYRLTLKSVYEMCVFCFIGFLWGEHGRKWACCSSGRDDVASRVY